jgi:hypothetical protein
MPDGSSMKIRARNQADVTEPTRTPDGSSWLARIGRKDREKPMPKINENPIIIIS